MTTTTTNNNINYPFVYSGGTLKWFDIVQNILGKYLNKNIKNQTLLAAIVYSNNIKHL